MQLSIQRTLMLVLLKKLGLICCELCEGASGACADYRSHQAARQKAIEFRELKEQEIEIYQQARSPKGQQENSWASRTQQQPTHRMRTPNASSYVRPVNGRARGSLETEAQGKG